MALFGTDMTEVTTPDGRRITVPQQLAQAFPGLQPYSPPPEVAQPPVFPVAPPPPTFTPQDQQDLSKLTAAPPPDASGAPVTMPSQSPPQGPGGPRGPVATPAQETDAGRPNTPGPMTNDQLAKIGTAGAYNASVTAQQGERAAVQRQGEALANQATAVGKVMEAADRHADELLAERARVAQENAAALQAKTEEYQRNAKAVADTKIDRSVDHPVLAALSSALIGIGQAMAGQPIDAMGAVYKAIDRKVAAQMQDLDQKRANLGLQRDALGMQREAGRDRLAEMDTLRLGYIEQAKRQVETIKQQTTSDVVRANADVALANLDQKAADTLGTAVQREQQKREAEAARKQTLMMHQQTIGVQLRGQNLEQKRFESQLEFQKQKEIDEIATKIATAKGLQKSEVEKKIAEQGVVDPSTGSLILTPEGQKKFADAEKAEAAARAAKDQAQAQKLNDYAGQLRDSARINDVAFGVNKESAQEAMKVLKNTQNLTNDIDTAKQMLERGPDAWNREEWAQLKVGLQNVKINYATTIGERLSVRALEALDDVLSVDTDSVFSRSVDKGKALAALKTLNTELIQKGNVALRGAGIKTTWNPATATKAEQLGSEKTAQELAADATPGGFRGDVEQRLGELGARTEMDAALEEANARRSAPSKAFPEGRTSDYGLAPDTDEKIRALVSQSAKVGHEKYADIIGKLRAPLEGDRPSLAIGTARLIRDTDPKLFADVMASLPEATRNEIAQSVAPPQLSGPYTQRTTDSLSPEERAQLEEQRRQRTTEAERARYRAAYDERAAKGARGVPGSAPNPRAEGERKQDSDRFWDSQMRASDAEWRAKVQNLMSTKGLSFQEAVNEIGNVSDFWDQRERARLARGGH